MRKGRFGVCGGINVRLYIVDTFFHHWCIPLFRGLFRISHISHIFVSFCSASRYAQDRQPVRWFGIPLNHGRERGEIEFAHCELVGLDWICGRWKIENWLRGLSLDD
jgi:hypothetical protein